MYYQDVADDVPLNYGLSTTFAAYGGQIGLSSDQYDQVFLYNSQSGVPIPVAYTQTGTFQVQQGHTYLIQLGLETYAAPGFTGNQMNHLLQGADFSNTAVFQFTDLDGATVSSASGQFLSTPLAAQTPEPSSIALLGTGALSCLAMIRRKYKRS